MYFALLFLLISSYFDVRYREIPDLLVWPFFLLGILLHLNRIFELLHVIFLCLLIDSILYKLGVWAGGDFKFFLAFSTLFPFSERNFVLAPPISVFTNTLLCSISFIVLRSLLEAKRRGDLSEIVKKSFGSIYRSFPFVFSLVALSKRVHWILSSTLGLAFLFLPKKLVYAFFFPIFLYTAFYDPFYAIFLSLTQTLILFISFLTFESSKYFLKKISRMKVPVEMLEEGMILSKSIVEQNGRIVEFEPDLEKFARELKEGGIKRAIRSLKPKGKMIVNASKADGLTKEEIEVLKKLKEQGLIELVEIKKSMPLIPFFLPGFLIFLALGDLFLLLVAII